VSSPILRSQQPLKSAEAGDGQYETLDDDEDDVYGDRGKSGNNDEARARELWDATIRLLRLMANISIDEKVGTNVALSGDGLQVLNELLVGVKANCSLSTPPYDVVVPAHSPGQKETVQPRITNGHGADYAIIDDEANEELLLNIVAACTNVTFYACQPQLLTMNSTAGQQQSSSNTHKIRMQCLVDMARHLSTCLFHDNEEIVLETARALGNLTRYKGVLDCLSSSRASEALIILLDHANRDVVSAVTGVLVRRMDMLIFAPALTI
jgi:hypothetical protein